MISNTLKRFFSYWLTTPLLGPGQLHYVNLFSGCQTSFLIQDESVICLAFVAFIICVKKGGKCVVLMTLLKLTPTSTLKIKVARGFPCVVLMTLLKLTPTSTLKIEVARGFPFLVFFFYSFELAHVNSSCQDFEC